MGRRVRIASVVAGLVVIGGIFAFAAVSILSGARQRSEGPYDQSASGTSPRRPSRSACTTAWAIARSWIASPVESNSVTASSPGRPGRLARQHAAEVRDVLAVHQPGLHGARQLAAVARLGPLVAEQREPGHELDLYLSLTWAVGAQRVDVGARPQLAGADRRARGPA